ncbi:hypothetical protein CLOP_g1300 [Closterium sp. NIES-67]|nr:hypothetical protein CLOP_g1300 [Closterium sp. NIES-67]
MCEFCGRNLPDYTALGRHQATHQRCLREQLKPPHLRRYVRLRRRSLRSRARPRETSPSSDSSESSDNGPHQRRRGGPPSPEPSGSSDGSEQPGADAEPPAPPIPDEPDEPFDIRVEVSILARKYLLTNTCITEIIQLLKHPQLRSEDLHEWDTHCDLEKFEEQFSVEPEHNWERAELQLQGREGSFVMWYRPILPVLLKMWHEMLAVEGFVSEPAEWHVDGERRYCTLGDCNWWMLMHASSYFLIRPTSPSTGDALRTRCS